jgi:hypothetical protein
VFGWLLSLLLLAGLGYWLRGYRPVVLRTWQQARLLWQTMRQVRDLTRGLGGQGQLRPPGSGPMPPWFGPSNGQNRADPKVVDVAPRQRQPDQQRQSGGNGLKVVCPACQDALSQAQLEALRQGSIRCAGEKAGHTCPFRAKTLN